MAPHRPLLTTAFAALLLLAPAAVASYSFGSIVDKNDFDFQPLPSVRGTVPVAGKFVLPCFLDDDGDARMDPGEALYLAVRTGLTETCAFVRQKDVRLTPFGALAAGSEVKAGHADPDAGINLVQLGSVATPGHAIRVFNDGETLATVRKSDTVYLDVSNLALARVGVGDIRLSSYLTFKAGTVVQAGDPDMNLKLDEFNGGAIKSFYTANMVFEFGKGWYLNADVDALAGGAVEEGDVRLTSAVPNPFADIAANIANPGPVVDGLSFSKKTVAPGEMFQVSITVKNPTAKIGSALVKTSMDGVLVDARGTPTLVKDEVSTLVVSLFAPAAAGQHKVTAGEYTRFLTVEAPAPSGSPPTSSAAALVNPVAVKQGAAGLEPLAMLGVLVLALVSLRRRVA